MNAPLVLEPQTGRKSFLLPPAATIQASSPFGVTRVGQDLATKPPPFPRRSHSYLCNSGPAAPLHGRSSSSCHLKNL